MYFERIKQTLTSDNELFGLFFHRQRTNESCNFLSGLPLGKLTQTLLTSPEEDMNNLQEQLTSSWVEDKDSSIDWLGRQVALKCFVDGDTIGISIVDKELYLVA